MAQPISHEEIFSNRKKIGRGSTERKERGDGRSESQDKRNRIFVESSVEIAFIGRKSFVIMGRARGKNSLDRVEWWFLTRFQVLPV